MSRNVSTRVRAWRRQRWVSVVPRGPRESPGTAMRAGGQRENGRDQIGRDVSKHGNDSYREQEWGHD